MVTNLNNRGSKHLESDDIESKRIRSQDNRSKFLERDSSLFIDQKRADSFKMDDENRQFTQANDYHSSSINKALKKRQGSTQ